jgi:hypothetical protein
VAPLRCNAVQIMSNAAADGDVPIVLREIGAALESVYPKVHALWRPTRARGSARMLQRAPSASSRQFVFVGS